MSEEQDRPTKTDNPLQLQRSVSPTPSDVSMKSDWSKDYPPNFREGDLKTEPSPLQLQRSVSPTPSDVSMKSDWSKDYPPNFREGDLKTEPSPLQQQRPVSPLPGSVPMKSNRSNDDPLNFRKGLETEPRGQSVQGDQSGKTWKENDAKEKLAADLKNKILDQYEEEMHQNEIYTELYFVKSVKNKKEDQQLKLTKYDEIFKQSLVGKKIRTVLTKGVAGVQKIPPEFIDKVTECRGKNLAEH
uniref:uncharacterized protein n=1 Tax=Centroberyx gerrardi TaxID=166262 RepID=UPI003AABD1BE